MNISNLSDKINLADIADNIHLADIADKIHLSDITDGVSSTISNTGLDFWNFLTETNVLQLGVAFIIAMQVNALGTSFIDDIVSPIIDKIFGDYEESVKYKKTALFGIEFQWDDFIVSIIKFFMFMVLIYLIFSITGLRKLIKK